MSENSLLKVKNLTKRFHLGGLLGKKYLTAVDDVSFDIPEDKAIVTTLAGESGSGKTTTARLILGFIKPTSGEILYKGKNIWKISKRERETYRREVQAIFQDPYGVYNPFYKVDYVLKQPIKKFKLAQSRNEAREMINDMLENVGLRPDQVLGKYPHQLSGGERQRIILARAFLLKPRLVVADEPVSMIDISLRAIVLKIMLDLKEKYRSSFLYITHDLSTAYYVSDNIIILYLGSIVEQGDIDAIIEKPAHPYTRTLMRSIPIPDPEARWKGKVKLPVEEITPSVGTFTGCKFFSRCPNAMDACAKERPPLIDLSKEHQVACYLYSK